MSLPPLSMPLYESLESIGVPLSSDGRGVGDAACQRGLPNLYYCFVPGSPVTGFVVICNSYHSSCAREQHWAYGPLFF